MLILLVIECVFTKRRSLFIFNIDYDTWICCSSICFL